MSINLHRNHLQKLLIFIFCVGLLSGFSVAAQETVPAARSHLTAANLPANAARLNEFYKKVHGFERTGELSLALQAFKPFVVLHGGKIPAYASTVSMWQLNHGVAETESDMRDLLVGASAELGEPVSLLLPTRQANFHRRALQSGLRMIQPLTLMAMGEYYEPNGSWFPSVLY